MAVEARFAAVVEGRLEAEGVSAIGAVGEVVEEAGEAAGSALEEVGEEEGTPTLLLVEVSEGEVRSRQIWNYRALVASTYTFYGTITGIFHQDCSHDWHSVCI